MELLLLISILLPYVVIIACFYRYRRLINMAQDLSEIFDVVDTPAEAVDQPIDKRQALKDARKSKPHLLSKKYTEAFLDKSSPEVIDKIYNDFTEHDLHEKGEKTAKALSTYALGMYSKTISNLMPIDDVEALRNDLENDPIIRESMTELGILVYTAFGKFLAPLLVAAHTINHTKLYKQSSPDSGELVNDTSIPS
ncbi:uncharacterized protein LOC130626120 [Hydractinia symbiolongicarpus]|uniref:uncharacterized protein LOC130626120 n=1 Tax=Hydractinia symbiolongicarpus TaxID=13093 RepID=UPI00254D9F1A|nr:uncharacterized protein LOC130626120 [Hydractinia symbiolongicarpus]